MINWSRLDPATVERGVKMLIRRLHPTALGIDGTGGDDGQDIRWEAPEGLVIFEVKSHTDRLTAARKRNIKKSLMKAERHTPIRWCLIIPLDPSPAETAWFEGLRAEVPAVGLEWRGRDWLDEQFAAHEDLRRLVEGSDYELLARAEEFGHEQAVLAGGLSDVLSRHQVLASRVGELSPHWALDVVSTSDGITTFFREKYPGAAQHDPITLTPVLRDPKDDPEAQRVLAALRRAIDFGSAVTIPSELIERLDVEASDETRRLFGLGNDRTMGDFHLVPVNDTSGLPLVARLERLSDDGRVLDGVGIVLTERQSGRLGGTLFGSDASGVLSVEIRYAPEIGSDDQANSFYLTLKPLTRHLPYAIRPVLGLLAGFAEGNQIAFRVGPKIQMSAPVTAATLPGADLRDMLQLVAAFEELQDHNGSAFPIPDDELTTEEIRNVIDLASALRWETVRLMSNVFNATVESRMLPEMLAAVPAEGALLLTHEEFGYEIAGHELAIGSAQLYAPKMRLADRAELVALGVNAEPVKVRFVPFDGEGIYLSRLGMVGHSEEAPDPASGTG